MVSDSEGQVTENAPSEEILIDENDLVDAPMADGIEEFLSELRDVRKQMDKVDSRIDEYLSRIRKGTQAAVPDASGIQGIFDRLDELSAQIHALEKPLHEAIQVASSDAVEQANVAATNADSDTGDGDTGDGDTGDGDTGVTLDQVVEQQRVANEELAHVLTEQMQGHQDALDKLRGAVGGRLKQLAEWLRPAEEDPSSAQEQHGQWRETIFGARLVANPDLSGDLDQLQEEILRGDDAALSLAGQLLTFRSATPDRMPQVLKDLGEAFYRSRPKTVDADSRLELALKDDLQAHCEAASVPNRIELVRVGDRFDASRHAGGRGRTVTEVHGWVVVRDTGRVYTKATVVAE